MNVTVPGRSGLRNAYRSVPSTCGSAATSGASRWLDANPAWGPRPATSPAPRATAAPAATATFRNRLPGNNEDPSLGDGHRTATFPAVGHPPAPPRHLAG